MVPHGMSVIVNAPSVFRFTSPACPDRHLDGARLLGAQAPDAAPEAAGEALAQRLIGLMRAAGIPNGVGGVGYGKGDLPALARGAFAQQRLIKNAPRSVDEAGLEELFAGALTYW